MARRREAEPVSLNAAQRKRLERLWFVYGNHRPKTTPGNHQFIQSLIEHGLDPRPLQTKRTPNRDRPTEGCEVAVEAVLTSTDDDGEGISRLGFLWLIPSPNTEREKQTSDPELKRVLDEMRRRLSAARDCGGFDTGGKGAA